MSDQFDFEAQQVKWLCLLAMTFILCFTVCTMYSDHLRTNERIQELTTTQEARR